MKDPRHDFAEALDRLELIPSNNEVDSALRLLKAFLKIRDPQMRRAIVELAESYSTPRARRRLDN